MDINTYIKFGSVFFIVVFFMITLWTIYSVRAYAKSEKRLIEKVKAIDELQRIMWEYIKKSSIRLDSATEEERQSPEYKEETEALKNVISALEELQKKSQKQ